MNSNSMQDILKDVYPQGAQYERLLPQPQASSYKNIDLSRYNLENLGLIGNGSFANVFKVRDKRNGRILACKITSLNKGRNNSIIAERALQEIKLLKKVNASADSGIQLYSYTPSEQKIQSYINTAKALPGFIQPPGFDILELIQLGVTWTKFEEYHLKQHRKLTEKQAAALLMDLVLPVHNMHRATDIVHRDIKKDNVLLVNENGKVRAVLADFNISKVFEGKSNNHYTICYTPGFIHPEFEYKIKSHMTVTYKEAEQSELYGIMQIAYCFFNSGYMAPIRGQIPTPPNSPSAKISSIICSALNPSLARMPSFETIISQLKSILNGSNRQINHDSNIFSNTQCYTPKNGKKKPEKNRSANGSSSKKNQSAKYNSHDKNFSPVRVSFPKFHP